MDSAALQAMPDGVVVADWIGQRASARAQLASGHGELQISPERRAGCDPPGRRFESLFSLLSVP